MVGFISLADAKIHLKVEDDSEDGLITSLILAASAHVEEVTGLVCPVRAGEAFAFDGFPRREFVLRRRPIAAESVSVSYVDPAGDPQTFDELRIVERGGLTRVCPGVGAAWPVAACVRAAVTISADVGFAAATDAVPSSAPADVKHAVRLLVGHLFGDREGESKLPSAIAQLLHAHRIIRV